VADLISRKLRGQVNALERAAQKANTLRKVNRDMKDWDLGRCRFAKSGNGRQTDTAIALTGDSDEGDGKTID
jgi:hypothetical protein